MNGEMSKQIEHAISEDGRLRVQLVPMPAGDNPWRTQGDYRQEQKRDSIRFWITIAALVVATVGNVATAATAIHVIATTAQETMVER